MMRFLKDGNVRSEASKLTVCTRAEAEVANAI